MKKFVTAMKTINIITRSFDIRPDEMLDADFYRKDCNLLVNGKFLLKEWQTSIEHVRKGLFIICKYDKVHNRGDCRLIDENGKDLIPYPCDSIRLADPGAVCKCGGNKVSRFDTDRMLFKVRRAADRKENFVRRDGTPVYPHWFDSYETQCPTPEFSRHIKVKDDGLVNYIDATTGEPISTVSFEDRNCPNRNTIWENRQKYGDSYVATVKFHGKWKALLSNGDLQ